MLLGARMERYTGLWAGWHSSATLIQQNYSIQLSLNRLSGPIKTEFVCNPLLQVT